MVNDNAEPAPETVGVSKGRGSVRGTVKYPWGVVSGAKITAGTKTVTSDSTGKFEIPDLDSGVYDIAVQAPFPGYESGAQRVEITDNQTSNLDLYLDFKKAVVEGYVRDPDGKPIVGATLSGVLCGKDVGATTTDERGYFRFARVSPGERFIRANASGYEGDARDFVAKEDSATTIEFRLTPATCRIHGIVSGPDGKPLQADLLLLKSGIVAQKTSSDRDTGQYEFLLLPGSYQVLLSAAGYEAKGWHGEISGDTRTDFSLSALRVEAGTKTPRRLR